MADEESSVVLIGKSAEIGINRKNANPPVDAYIGVDDVLNIFVATALTPQVLTVQARILMPDGSIVPSQWTVSPPNQRIGFNFPFQLPEGFLLGITVTNNIINGPGGTFVKLFLTRGSTGIGPVYQVLAAGYVSQFNNLSYPTGRLRQSTDGRGLIRSITGTTPAAGAEVSETVPTNALWRLIAFQWLYTASAVVANRHSRLSLDDGAAQFALYSPLSVVAGSSANVFSWGPGVPTQYIGGGVLNGPIAIDMLLQPGFRIRSSTNGMQAGDQYSAVQYLVEEWILG